VIKPASSVKLLGVILDKHLTFGEHIDSTVDSNPSVYSAALRGGCCVPPCVADVIVNCAVCQQFNKRTSSLLLLLLVKTCHGILRSLTCASSFLSRGLHKLAYTALVRSRLKYCSAIFASASSTQLTKLDTVQKTASRIICGAAGNTHSAPLLEALNLESLDKRRTDHIISLVDSIISENCHPALLNMFTVLLNSNASTDKQA